MSAEPDPGLLQGFSCVARRDARALILGSMPGQASLDQAQYYAHPRNAFWYIMGRLFDAGPEQPYSQRLEILQQRGLALWDVVHRCARKGSLDADIEHDSVEPNDLRGLFMHCPNIRHVFFNGRKAADLYRRMIEPTLGPPGPIHYQTLPSTSPAHASLDREAKLRHWSAIKTLLAN
jgi:double-stranded uracil-DNA glycosylase